MMLRKAFTNADGKEICGRHSASISEHKSVTLTTLIPYKFNRRSSFRSTHVSLFLRGQKDHPVGP